MAEGGGSPIKKRGQDGARPMKNSGQDADESYTPVLSPLMRGLTCDQLMSIPDDMEAFSQICDHMKNNSQKSCEDKEGPVMSPEVAVNEFYRNSATPLRRSGSGPRQRYTSTPVSSDHVHRKYHLVIFCHFHQFFYLNYADFGFLECIKVRLFGRISNTRHGVP